MSGSIPLETRYSDELMKAVGLLFITASNIEAALGLQVARCLCHPHTINQATATSCAGIELKTKLRQIEISTQILFPQHLDGVKKITSSIRRQFDHRNAIAHNCNFGSGDDLRVIPLKMSNKGAVREKTFVANQITNIARMMHARTRQLDECLIAIGFAKLPKEST